MPAHAPHWTDLQWQDMPMPDANAAVRMAVLEPAGRDQFLAMVQFPPGWERLHAGHYAVDEEFFVLSGDLQLSSMCWHGEQHGFVPAYTLRHATRSDAGCTAYARFYGRPRWVRGGSGRAPAGAVTQITDWRRIAPWPCALHTGVRLLHQGCGVSTWMVDEWPVPGFPLKPPAMDSLRLSDGVHCCGLPDDRQPAAAGPVLLHCIASAPAAPHGALTPP